MVTIHRQHGLRFVISTQDHEPAHVHIYGNGELKVALRDNGDMPLLIHAIGMKVQDRRRAMDVVLERQAEFLARWRQIHGLEMEGDEL